MGAAHSAHSVDLAVLVEFDDLDEADGFMSAALPRHASRIGLKDVVQDGDIVRMEIHVDGISTGHLRSIKRALIGHSTGRVFVKDARGRYRAWHSKQLCDALSRELDGGDNRSCADSVRGGSATAARLLGHPGSLVPGRAVSI